MKIWLVITAGLFVHVIFFVSIFEIYFTTPLVNGMTPHASPLEPPAKRLVFIVADGLRADKILEIMPNGKTPAPYLRNIVETKGAWGVSHAAVPTATRPGHVALTAGFYEDPTSVVKDIQGNEVVFDTIFNQSRFTWSWDTPKFLSKITGGNANRMFSKKYPGNMKWLAGLNAAEMDNWVLQETHELFQKSKTDSLLKARMAEDRILFFLHLGGLDHSGYIVRPNSEAYLEHITLVDNGVENVVKDIEEHYNNDGRTAYVFTSDHGMTDWGAHGDGTLAETLTPLIAWGPGIRAPEKETQTYPDGLSEAWSLSKLKRTDIRQGSMAAFLAALIGIPYPMNSVLPVPEQLFNITDHEEAEMLFANLRQLLAQYESVKEERQHNSLRLTFSEFEPLQPQKIADIHKSISSLIEQKKYKDASSECKRKIELTLQGLRFYQTYDRFNLWFSVIASYIGWMLYMISILAEEHMSVTSPKQLQQLTRRVKGAIVTLFTTLSITIFMSLYIQSVVWTTYFYILLPCPIWLAVCLRINILRQMLSLVSTIKPLLPYFLLTFVGLEMIVLGFYYREVYSLVLLCVGVCPWILKKDQVERRVLFQWLISCLTVAFFPMLPVGERELNFNLVVFGGVLVIAVACFLVKTIYGGTVDKNERRFAAKQLGRKKLILIFGFQILVIAISIIIVRHTAEMAATNRRTPIVSQVLSWIFLGLGIIEPFLVTTDIRCRLLTIVLAWMSPFILFSISYECLFMVCLCWNLYVWMLMEASYTSNYNELLPMEVKETIVNGKCSQENPSKFLESMDYAAISNQIANGKSRQTLVRGDLRRAFYFVFLVMASLFGTGNVASVNSFDPAAVFCFLTVSNPPFMGILISLKICIPFIMIACALRTVNLVTHSSLKSFTFLAFLLVDIVALHFFLLVNDNGSWLEVGEAVSHYVIFQIINIIMMLLFGVSYLLTTCSICCFCSCQ